MNEPTDISPGKPATHRLWKITAFAGGAVLICVLALYIFTHAYFDGILRSKITGAIQTAYPTYTLRIGSLHYSILRNCIWLDSIAVTKNDSTESCTIVGLTLSGINRMEFIRGGGDVPQGLASSYGDAHGIKLSFSTSEYELSCAHLQVSAPDSTLLIEGLAVQPYSDDEQFFAVSKYRTTRFLVDVPTCRVSGLGCLGFMTGKEYRARSVQLDGVSLALLVNKDKPDDPGASLPQMPNEALAGILPPVYIDSVGISNGHVLYNEQFQAGAKPAAIWWDSLNLSAQKLGNLAGGADTALVQAHGVMLNAAVMDLQLSLPLAPGEFSVQYSGSLTEMALSKLNSFIEIAEHKRLKTGMIYNTSFSVDVKAGRATGTVRANYKDLKIVAIDGRTGSENGIGNRIASFLANNVMLRTSNETSKSGARTVGKVKYSRGRGDTFIYFAWVSLRSGIQSLVGF